MLWAKKSNFAFTLHFGFVFATKSCAFAWFSMFLCFYFKLFRAWNPCIIFVKQQTSFSRSLAPPFTVPHQLTQHDNNIISAPSFPFQFLAVCIFSFQLAEGAENPFVCNFQEVALLAQESKSSPRRLNGYTLPLLLSPRATPSTYFSP